RLALIPKDSPRRKNANSSRQRRFRRIRRRPIDQPRYERLKLLALGVDSLSTGMRNVSSGLADKQAVFRRRQIDPTAGHFPRQTVMVTSWVVTKQTQPKTIFTRSGAVALSGVAAGPRQDRQHIVSEPKRWGGVRIGHLDRN